MVYLNADGTVVEKRTVWRLSIVSDFLWGVVDFFWLFFQTMIDPQSEHHSLRPRGGSSRGGRGPKPPGGGSGGARRVRGLKDCSSSSMKAAGAGG
mmetsp:Transcript_12520/g.37224  ORF Transcript_12520/g.37224 Transcript_12520/m.37224 type:complete len:95 (+) Transcript_12520:229-513(+)